MHSQPTTPDWRKVPSFPNYEINQFGMVRTYYVNKSGNIQICYLPPLTKYADTPDPKILLRKPDTNKPSKQSQARAANGSTSFRD